MSCRSIQPRLHVESSALDEAERLLLEAHLQGCERCQTAREQLVLVRRIGGSLPTASIGPRGYGRAIARALMAGAPAPAPVRARVRWWMPATAAGATAAAALAAVLVLRSGGAAPATSDSGRAAPPEHPPAPAGSTPELATPGPATPRAALPSPRLPAAPELALAEGTLVRGGTALPAGAALPADVALSAETPARIVVYGASVVISASSRVRWIAPERTLLLEAGSLHVDGGTARIATPRFRVEVSGAAAITERTVSLQRGSARVTGADGRSSRLDAGAAWTAPEPPVAKPSAGAVLAQARQAFAAGDHAAAARRAETALAADPSRAQAAEARTLLAECAHAAGRLDDALRRYEAIAAQYVELPAGETALFAAARLEASRGRSAAARALFERYLERYPSGRFAGDARRHTRAPR